MQEPFISVKNLSYTYEDSDGALESAPALSHITLDIKKGEYIAVLGHNGSGKSTFAKLLNLLLEPTEGELFIDGKNYSDHELSDDEVLQLRKKVGMIFQNPDNQLVASIVEEDVAFGPENLGIKLPELATRVENALKDVNMLEFAQHEPHRLSGGQKQRIAIAGVLAMKPECIIFDESTAMLDPAGRREVLDTMARLNKEQGITIIHITHYMNEAAEANRILVINDGKLVMDDIPDKIFARQKDLEKIGLAVPQCAELIHELIKRGIIKSSTSFADMKKTADVLLTAFKEAQNG